MGSMRWPTSAARLVGAERNYCVTRRELLAVVLAVRHFKPYLHGKRFLVPHRPRVPHLAPQF